MNIEYIHRHYYDAVTTSLRIIYEDALALLHSVYGIEAARRAGIANIEWYYTGDLRHGQVINIHGESNDTRIQIAQVHISSYETFANHPNYRHVHVTVYELQNPLISLMSQYICMQFAPHLSTAIRSYFADISRTTASIDPTIYELGRFHEGVYLTIMNSATDAQLVKKRKGEQRLQITKTLRIKGKYQL